MITICYLGRPAQVCIKFCVYMVLLKKLSLKTKCMFIAYAIKNKLDFDKNLRICFRDIKKV